MFNPLVDSFESLTDNQIEDKISELSRKYFSTRNPQLQMQIATILDMYKVEAQSRRAIAMQKMRDEQDGESGLDNLINVS